MLIASCVLVGCKEQLPTLPPTPAPTSASAESSAVEPSNKTPAVEPSTETPTAEPSTETPTVEPSTETPTVEPSTETPTVEPSTETPTETPVAPDDPTSLSGTFRSDTGTALELQLDYKIDKQANGDYLVSATVYLNCYSLYCAERTNCNTVTIGNTDYLYSTEKLSLETGAEKNHVKVADVTHTIAAGELPDNLYIGATWLFKGSYSKVPIDTLEASGTVKIR